MTEKLKIIGKRIFLIILDKFILQTYGDNVSRATSNPTLRLSNSPTQLNTEVAYVRIHCKRAFGRRCRDDPSGCKKRLRVSSFSRFPDRAQKLLCPDMPDGFRSA